MKEEKYNKKGFIMDGNKIRYCDANIAKMSILQHMWLDLKEGHPFKGGIESLWDALQELGSGLLVLVLVPVSFVLFPVPLFMRAWNSIRRAKKERAIETQGLRDNLVEAIRRHKEQVA